MTITDAPSVLANEQRTASPDLTTRKPSRERLVAAWPVAILVAIPALVYGASYLFGGHLLLAGDNLIQSYPLRVLVGQDLRGGLLPTWDPWIWGGTPLLAGLNAGAFYPTTFLFAVMSPGAAWVLGEIFMSSSISVGTYLFLRITGVSRAAGFVGALSFTFAGAIAGQTGVHMDMAEGLASLPWMLIAVRRLVDDGRWRWCILLAVSGTMLILAGSPEAMLDVGILAAGYGLLRLTVTPGAWWWLVSRASLAACFAIGASSTTWVPSVAFISTSQRSTETAAFAATYSYPPRAFILGLIPYFEGGSKLFSQPPYFGQSNLPEIAMYVGVLPLIAFGALLSRRWKDWLPSGERRIWYVIAIVGAVLAIGDGTQLEHVIAHIPFYGKQRNQGRNIVDVDFAACVLFAWWVDGGLRPKGVRTRSELVTGSALLATVGAVGVAFAVSPSWVWRMMRDVPQASSTIGALDWAIVLSGVIVAVGTAVAVARSRLGERTWTLAVTAFVVLDVAFFATGSSLLTTQVIPTAQRPGTLMSLVDRNLTPGGRYAVFDNDLFYLNNLVEAGEANVGIMTGAPSLQGYGAIVDNLYAYYTGTHERGFLNPIGIEDGAYKRLGLEVIVAPAEAFLLPIAAVPATTGTVTPLVEGAGTDPALPGGDTPLAQSSLPQLVQAGPRGPIYRGKEKGWFFGTTLHPTSAYLVTATATEGQTVRVGIVTPSGADDWIGTQQLGRGTVKTRLSLPGSAAVGVLLQLQSGPTVAKSQLVVGEGGRLYLDDGPLAVSITPESFGAVGSADEFSVYLIRQVPPTIWAQPSYSEGSSTGALTEIPAVTTEISSTTTTEIVEIDSSAPSLLTRSVAYDAGWSATIMSGTKSEVEKAAAYAASGQHLSASTPLTVNRVGLVQGVEVPAGWSVVRFTYEPVGFGRAEEITALTFAATALGITGVGVNGRLRRRRKGRPGRARPVAEAQPQP